MRRNASKLPMYECIQCGTVKRARWGSTANLFCSIKCQMAHNHVKHINSWLSGEIDGNCGTGTNKHVQRYIREKYNFTCQGCGITDWQGKPIVLTIEHIDGDAYNSKEDNLTLLCPNCHSQTPTYAGRNKGKGTRIYRKKYDDKYAAIKRQHNSAVE